MSQHALDIFETIRRERNGVAEIHAAFSDFPIGVAAHYDFYKKLILDEDLPLPRIEREFLAFKTSESNDCPYCIGHHRAAFDNSSSREMDQSRSVLLELLASNLTKEPWKAHLIAPKFLEAGFTRAEWQHAVMIVSYFNFANRCAHAMNLHLEENFESTCK